MTRSARRRGFTLIELLVVISIIALLIGILLPSLGRARDAARKGVCLAQQRQAATGMYNYTTEFKDWIAGPNTSGRDVGDGNFTNNPDEPIQNMDWVSPTIGRSIGLPDGQPGDLRAREYRLRMMFEQKFACPANKETYDGWFGGGGTLAGEPVTDLRVSSYSSALGFHFSNRPSDPVNHNTPGASFPVELTGYRPQLGKVLNPERKVYSMDGTRYVDRGDNFKITFNAFTFQDEGGNFMTQGPAILGHSGDPHTAGGAGPNFTEAERQAMERYAYRHRGSIVVSFFDGHAAEMSEEESRKMSYWFPTGSKVRGRNFEGLRPGQTID
ncbi:MAG: type II secretion system protein [Phycisphaerales bacterium]